MPRKKDIAVVGSTVLAVFIFIFLFFVNWELKDE